MDWTQTSEALDAAENVYRDACGKFGQDSPEAMVADEQAFDALRAHQKNSDVI